MRRLGPWRAEVVPKRPKVLYPSAGFLAVPGGQKSHTLGPETVQERKKFRTLGPETAEGWYPRVENGSGALFWASGGQKSRTLLRCGASWRLSAAKSLSLIHI